jgi:hypothetical protein
MSDAAKSQEPSMEEILASIRRIIAEDEAGRSRTGPAPLPPRGSTDGPSRTPRGRNGQHEVPPARGGETSDVVLDLTNMVAADGSVVTIAPTFPQANRPAPQSFAPPGNEQQTAPYGGFPRRAPPPGPGAEPRAPSFAPAPQAGFPGTDTPSRRARGQDSSLAPIPAALSEDSPSRRVFKRRHTAGSAFAELAQSGFAAQPGDANGGFGKVPAGSVATELDMSAPPPATSMAPRAPAAYAAPDPYAGPAYAAPSAMPEEQMRAAVGAAAEPIIRAWLDANLGRMIDQQVSSLIQQRVDQAVAASLTQAVDQRIHQNVEANLGPYIEDRVGAHVDARLAAAVEEKVTAAVKQQVAAAVNQQVAQAVSQQVAAAVSQQLQGQQQNITRVVDERVKSEIRGLFQRLAEN